MCLPCIPSASYWILSFWHMVMHVWAHVCVCVCVCTPPPPPAEGRHHVCFCLFWIRDLVPTQNILVEWKSVLLCKEAVEGILALGPFHLWDHLSIKHTSPTLKWYVTISTEIFNIQFLFQTEIHSRWWCKRQQETPQRSNMTSIGLHNIIAEGSLSGEVFVSIASSSFSVTRRGWLIFWRDCLDSLSPWIVSYFCGAVMSLGRNKQTGHW